MFQCIFCVYLTLCYCLLKSCYIANSMKNEDASSDVDGSYESMALF